MKEIELSETNDDEKNSFITNDTDNIQENKEENKDINNIIKSNDSTEFLMKVTETNNKILNEINSNSPLINNKTPNRFFGLKLYVNNDICFQLFKMTKIGKSKAFFYNENDDPLLIIGPDWPFVAFLFSIFNFFYVLIIIKFWIRFSLFSKCVNQITYWSFLISFLYTSFINQGYPKNSICRKTGNPSDEYYYCEQCHLYNYIYNSINHCNKCGICIEGQEHHCVWIGKCVGKNNINVK
jgi:hypothetical protein